ncbi:hypothetical protein ACG96_07065 [Rhodococcoides fascians]|nr:hypothetical protein ACG96_07065 [Rhodococcus fascians]
MKFKPRAYRHVISVLDRDEFSTCARDCTIPRNTRARVLFQLDEDDPVIILRNICDCGGRGIGRRIVDDYKFPAVECLAPY